MHFEVLVEDLSGKRMLDILVPRIVGDAHTFSVKSYKGIGRLPRGMTAQSEPNKRILLDQLPRLLQGYGQTFAQYPDDYSAVVFVICDLDDRCLKLFREELLGLLQRCHPAPKTQFCIAIEEGEAWLLGDIAAIKTAYAHAKDAVLNSYTNDSICGTWEKLADAIYPGGATKLKTSGWQMAGREKFLWANKITPHLTIDNNRSPSFCYFRDKLWAMTENEKEEQDANETKT